MNSQASIPDRPTGLSVSRLEAVGCVETRSIALGIEVADAMVKAAEVELQLATPTCPGKYLVVVSGTVAAVRSAVEIGARTARDTLTDQTVIPSVHPQVVPALSALTDATEIQALGVLETFTMPAALVAADQAVKSAQVKLIEIRLGRGLAGKAFVILTGEVAAVRAAIAAGIKILADQALILASTVIPSPHPGLIDKLL